VLKQGVLAAVLLTLVAALGSGCDAEKRFATPTAREEAREGFAIYLTEPEIRPDKLIMQSHLGIADAALLTEADLVQYIWASHEMTLTTAGYEKLHAIKLPTSGISFVVCINKSPVYAGAFWPAYSSQSWDGVTIDPILMTPERPVVKIELGYPGSGFYQGPDPRGDERIKAALEKAGKLK
jgi:hypothetical protein